MSEAGGLSRWQGGAGESAPCALQSHPFSASKLSSPQRTYAACKPPTARPPGGHFTSPTTQTTLAPRSNHLRNPPHLPALPFSLVLV